MNQRKDKPLKSRPASPRRRLSQQLRGLVPSLSSCDDSETMPPKIARVFGPYPNGKKWRLVVYNPNRVSMIVESKEAGERIKAGLLRHFEDFSQTTIEQALSEYLSDKERNGAVGRTVETMRYKLRQFLPVDATFAELTPQKALRLYTDETERNSRFGKPVSAATHRFTLRMVKAFFRWAVERKYTDANPFDSVKPIGKVRAGKAQLRIDEARKLSDLLIAQTEGGDEGALAVLVQVTMGLRSAEVLRLQVRDVDNAGLVLWVDGTKTCNARRALDVLSEDLQRLLVSHCKGKQATELLFGAGRSRPHDTDFLWHRLRKFCDLAGVPVVCPHSLRGLHSTLATTRGASSRLVADALGHGSVSVTKRHYIDATASRNASLKRVSEVLTNKPAQSTDPYVDNLAEALRSLAPEQMKALLAAVGERR